MSGQTGRSAIGKFRYVILALIFLVTVVNYADRAIISIAAPAMSDDLHIGPIELGFVFSGFAWTYVLAQLPSGWLLDRAGTRWVYAGSIILWSIFTSLQGLTGFVFGASAVAYLFGLRLLVGLAEAPSFPANARVVTMWFPTTERGFASAVFNSGQYFAPALFTPFMAWIVFAYGWRDVFWVMGGLGVLVAILWLRVFKSPQDSGVAGQQELDYIVSGGGLPDLDDAPSEKSRKSAQWGLLIELLRNRTLIGVYIGQYSIVTITYFFLTWFPVYLVKDRGFNILQAGFVAVLPALCGFVGGLSGGAVSDAILRRTGSQTVARKAPIVFGMLLSTVMVVCNFVDQAWLVVALMALAFFGKGVGSLGWAVVADTSPREAPGLSAGLFNTFGNIAGITTPIIIGYIVSASGGSFVWALAFVACNALLCLVSYLLIVGRIERVILQDRTGQNRKGLDA